MIMAGCLFSAMTFAQDVKHDLEARAKKMSEKMKTELSLSNDQYAKVYDINLKYAQKMADLKKEEGDHDSKKDSFRELNKSKNDELKTVLSGEQMQKYRDYQHDKRSKMKDHKKPAPQQLSK